MQLLFSNFFTHKLRLFEILYFQFVLINLSCTWRISIPRSLICETFVRFKNKCTCNESVMWVILNNKQCFARHIFVYKNELSLCLFKRKMIYELFSRYFWWLYWFCVKAEYEGRCPIKRIEVGKVSFYFCEK